MQNVQELSSLQATSPAIVEAQHIPALTHAEAGRIGRESFRRVLAVLESLEADEWDRPTACTEWTVRDMAAHLAGGCAKEASWAEFKRQLIQNPYMRSGGAPVDAINRRQVEDRARSTPAELLDELRRLGPKALRNHERMPWILRVVPFPFGGEIGLAPIGYLTDTIYPRDWWMHRLDLCRATGRDMELTADHDGRIVALVVRELAHRQRRSRGPGSILLTLTGVAGGAYYFGPDSSPRAQIRMDALSFNWLASGRKMSQEERDAISFEGDVNHAAHFLDHVRVAY